MARLVFDEISKTYRNGFTALSGISLSISSGVFALLGPNGAGKSTLMQIATGLLKPSRGNISVDGLRPDHELETYRTSIGYLPQSFGFPAGSTVRSVLEELGRLRGLAGSTLDERIEWSLNAVNLLVRANAPVSTLSGGMKQRLGIAQAVIHQPPVLILDEPTVGLDPDERNQLLLLLSDYAKDRTILLSTHLIDDVDAICQEMAFISNGTLLSVGSRDELLSPLNGHVFSLLSGEAASGRKLYDTVEQGKRVSRYIFERDVPPRATPRLPTVRDAYALTIPRGSL